MTTALRDSDAGLLLEECKAQLVALDLSGIGANWAIMSLPDIAFDPSQKFPPVGLINDAPEKIREGAGTNGQQDVVYVFLVTMAQAANTDQGVALPRKLLWRQEVRRLFHHRRVNLAGTGLNIVDVVVLKGTPTIPAVWRKHIDAQTWEVEITVREPYQ